MTIDEFKRKYPLSQWIINNRHLESGDIIVFWDEAYKIEKTGKFSKKGEGAFEITLQVSTGIFGPTYVTINTAETVCFKVKSGTALPVGECTCKGYDLFNFGCRCGYVKRNKA